MKLRTSALILAFATITLAAHHAAQAAATPATSRKLSNGLTLVTRIDRTAPRVALSLLVRAGAADETAATAGWRRLLADAMLVASLRDPAGSRDDTTNARPASALSRETEALGGHIGASVADDVIEFWATGDSAKTGELLDLLLSVARAPRLSDADINGARERLANSIEDDQADVAVRTTAALRSQLYRDARGELTAYGLPPSGSVTSLQALSNDRIRQLHHSYFTAGQFVLAATGDIDQGALEAKLSALPASGSSTTDSSAAPFFQPPNRANPPLIVRQMRTSSAWVFIAYAVPGVGHSDLPALRVLAAALSEAPHARLPQRLLNPRLSLENPEPLATRVAVQITPRRYASELVIFSQTDSQHIDATKNAILDELRKLKETPLGISELAGAKNYVLGSWAVEREDLRSRAFQTGLAPALADGADTDWPAQVGAVTAADVKRVAGKYLQAYAVALILPDQEQ